MDRSGLGLWSWWLRSGVFRGAEKFCAASLDGSLERCDAASAQSVLVNFDGFRGIGVVGAEGQDPLLVLLRGGPEICFSCFSQSSQI